MLRPLVLMFGAGLLGLGQSDPARAALLYQFADAGGTPASSFTVANVGDTLDVRVYLQEEAGGTELSTHGLFSASARVTFNSPGGVVAVLSPGDIAPNPAFTDLFPPPSVSATDAGFTGSVGLVDPLLFPDADNRIFLGTFRFTGLSPGSVTIEVMDRDPTSDDVVLGNGSAVDSVIETGTASFTVASAAVPAPAGIVLAGIGGLCLVGHGRLRRQGRRQRTA